MRSRFQRSASLASMANKGLTVAKKQYTIVVSCSSGYRTYRVKAEDWKDGDRIAEERHIELHPEEKNSEIGLAAVIKGWPEVW